MFLPGSDGDQETADQSSSREEFTRKDEVLHYLDRANGSGVNISASRVGISLGIADPRTCGGRAVHDFPIVRWVLDNKGEKTITLGWRNIRHRSTQSGGLVGYQLGYSAVGRVSGAKAGITG